MPLEAVREGKVWRNPRLESRIAEVDGLRGLAILLVLFFHYVTSIVAPRFPIWGTAMAGTRLFWCGVDLFFVLSGFLIAGILMDSAKSPRFFETFYLRRIHRIFPLYFGWLTLFYLGVWFDLDGKLGTNLFRSSIPLWMYPLFLQNNAPIWFKATAPGWMAMSWSLAVEEQFYLVLPAVVRLVSRRILAWLSGAVIVLSPVYRFLLVSRNSLLNEGWPFATLCRLDGLAMGVAVALLIRDEKVWTWLARNGSVLRWGCAILLGGFCWLTCFVTEPATMALFGFTVVTAFCTSLLLLVLCLPQGLASRPLRTPFLQYFGRISFAIYIFHQGVRGLFMDNIVPRWEPRFGTLRMLVVTFASLAVTLGLATLSWRFAESKLIRRAHTRYHY